MFNSHSDFLVRHSCGLGGFTWGYSGSRLGIDPVSREYENRELPIPPIKKKKDHQFLHMEDTFQGAVIEEGTHDEDLRNFTVILDPRSPESTSNLVNSIPKSVVRLEIFYELHDKFRKSVNCKTNSSSLTHEKVNLGTKDNPQCINLEMGSSEQENTTFIKLFKEFKDVFAWTYDDLKTFDPNIIQHIIPIKP
jgi:hypothetical protein